MLLVLHDKNIRNYRKIKDKIISFHSNDISLLQTVTSSMFRYFNSYCICVLSYTCSACMHFHNKIFYFVITQTFSVQLIAALNTHLKESFSLNLVMKNSFYGHFKSSVKNSSNGNAFFLCRKWKKKQTCLKCKQIALNKFEIILHQFLLFIID